MPNSLTQRLFNKQIKIIGKDELISEEGWRLRFMGNSPTTWRLLYAEKDREITIIVEGGLGGPRAIMWHVHFSAISGWGKSSLESFEGQERKRIKNNIRTGMKILKHVCKIV